MTDPLNAASVNPIGNNGTVVVAVTNDIEAEADADSDPEPDAGADTDELPGGGVETALDST